MTGSTLPSDYLERLYAGVLGKLIGVYVGRPFEGWSYQRILKKLGPIDYYVHERLDLPLVVTDDDVAGTFVFIRALQEHGATADISSEEIGKTWLNNTVEKKAIFWWGGKGSEIKIGFSTNDAGISTEHTAFLNLKHGIKAPLSGAIETNGQTVAEQIGAQIFIDGWALVAPGNPSLAARLAGAAGSVSHDGDSVHAAKLWAAMEAEAFVSSDIDHLLDVGLSYVPESSLITKLVHDIRAWAKADQDWEKTRQRIEDVYGYSKFKGVCHVIPNHGLMISTLIYAGHDFHRAMHIVNTSGWDTDCNSGNIGCLVAIINGLDGFKNGPDWRGPLADRALISSADGGYSLNNAARITYDLANLGRALAGESALAAPKNGAQFHFSLPGSVQGFIAGPSPNVKVEQAIDDRNRPSLAVRLNGLGDAAVEVLTQTFTPPEVVKFTTYDLMASPLVTPGQTVTAVVYADKSNSGSVDVILRLKHYNVSDSLSVYDGPSIRLAPGQERTLSWKVPDVFDSQPIQKVGIALASQDGEAFGTVWLDSLSITGSPCVTLGRPSGAQSDPFEPAEKDKPCTFWSRAWIDSLNTSHTRFPGASFYLGQDQGEGLFFTGTRDWTDYRVTVPEFSVKIGSAGIVARVQGLNRFYAFIFAPNHKEVLLLKAKDEERVQLARVPYEWSLDEKYNVSLVVQGDVIQGFIAGKKVIETRDGEYAGGGIGAVVVDGSVSIDQFEIKG